VFNLRWKLFFYDLIILALVDFLILVFYQGFNDLSLGNLLIHAALSFVCIFAVRIAGNVYKQIWRYGGIQCYIRLLIMDAIAFIPFFLLERLLPMEQHISAARVLSVSCMNLLGALAMRMMYRYAFKNANYRTLGGRILNWLLKVFAGEKIQDERENEHQKIKIAIVGAGRVGAAFVEELLNNEASPYQPQCFIDIDKSKVGRTIHGLPVMMEGQSTLELLKEYEIQEIVFAITHLPDAEKKRLYNYYMKAGYKIRLYDYPMVQTADGKRHLRDFDIDELLFRKQIIMNDEKTNAYYRDKLLDFPPSPKGYGAASPKKGAA